MIETTGNTPDAYYVQSATLNGEPLEQCWLYRDELYKGGTLKLTMGNQPNENGEWKIRLIVLNKQLIYLGADVA